MDLLGLSITRSQKVFFGDASTWITSFCVPILICGGWAIYRSPSSKYIKAGLVLCLLFGLYMSLGPSLKLNSQKPEGWTSSLMLAEHAVGPTGSSVLIELPGFENMRASYRWLALGVLGAWLLTITTLVDSKRGCRVLGGALLLLVVLLNLPDVPNKLKSDIKYRKSFLAIENEIVADLKEEIPSGMMIVFLPWYNDFLANYVAAAIDVRAYNIGGSKNLKIARDSWPSILRKFPMNSFDDNFSERVLRLLASKEADFVIIPYVNVLSAAHRWPLVMENKDKALLVAKELEAYGVLELVRRKYYISVNLHSDWQRRSEKEMLELLDLSPSGIRQKGFSRLPRTQVGELKDKWLVTTGRKGFLHFGPYMPLARGNYHFTLYGTAESASTVWVDIASSGGKKIHKKFNLSEMSRIEGNILISEEVSLDRTVSDLEIRVFVGEGDKLSIWGYSFE